MADANAFDPIALLADRRYRDHTLFDVRIYGEKIRALIDAHVQWVCCVDRGCVVTVGPG